MNLEKFKLTIAICLLVGTIGISQENGNGFIGPIYQGPTYISEELQKYVDEFVIEGFRRGLTLDDDIQSQVDAIIVVDYLPYPMVGLYLPKVNSRGNIYIQVHTLMDIIIVRRVLFHELGHALVIPMYEPHTCVACKKIMSSMTPESFAYLADYKVWSAELDEFFEWLKLNKKL